MLKENENILNSNINPYLDISIDDIQPRASIQNLEIRKLCNKITELETENNCLKKKLLDLNENTIVESMNDMKLQFEEWKENSICLDDFDNLKDYYIRNFEISKTIKTINGIMIDNLMSFKNGCTNDTIKMVENRRVRYIDRTMHYYQLIYDICSRHDGDDYIDPRFTE
jgi:hypothetical protein